MIKFAVVLRQLPGFTWGARLSFPTRTFHSPCWFPRCDLHTTVQKCRNINLLPISYAFRPCLRTDLPWDDCHCPGNLGLSMSPVFTGCEVTHANILSSTRSRAPRGYSFKAIVCPVGQTSGMLSYHSRNWKRETGDWTTTRRRVRSSFLSLVSSF